MYINKSVRYSFAFIFGLILSGHLFIGVKEAKAYKTPELYQMVEIVRGEIEIIRRYKERAIDERPSIPVEHVFPREVYFQALTLRQKAGRLCHEAVQNLMAPSQTVQFTIPKFIEPKDIYEIVNDAWSQIRCAKAGFNLSEKVELDSNQDSNKTLTDVFKAIVQANRQINLLLEQPIEPGDVYAVVQHANAYIVDILNKLAPVWSLTAPTLPEYQEGKTPLDVYKQMLKNFRMIQHIAKESGIDMLHLEDEIQSPIAASDVFDLSSLILSELRYFAVEVGVEDSIYKLKSYPDKVPSDVFQQAQMVEDHLEILQGITKQYPTWTRIE